MNMLGKGTGLRCVHLRACRPMAVPIVAHRSFTKLIRSQLNNVKNCIQHTRLMSDSAGGRLIGSAATEQTRSDNSSAQQDFLVQYVFVRKDLWTSLGWPLGSVVAQACHASSAAMWMYRDEEATQKYLAPDNIDNMRKVVLEVKDEAQLRKLGEQLTAAGVGHKLWIEQPENYPTCLATRPYAKSEVAPYFKKFQLSKAPIG